MSEMNTQERLALQNMLRNSDAPDTTAQIRELKHSKAIRTDTVTIQKLKSEYARIMKSNPSHFKEICRGRAEFLYNNYTNIFNKLVADDLNLEILHKFLFVLERIENAEIDQHEGSFLVGKLLKELYVDSALREDKKRDKKREKREKKPANPNANLSWEDYKKMKQ